MVGFSSFTDWIEPEYTSYLCRHVLQHGPQQWEELEQQLCVPAPLCALKWHGLQLSRSSHARESKAYTDWELCVLFLACFPQSTQLSKRNLLAELAKWLPGRSAHGLRQAYTNNIAGQEAKFAAKLQANNWPQDVTALLVAWPGPSAQTQANLAAEGSEGPKAVARQVMQEIGAWAPLAELHHTPAAAAAVAPAAAPGIAAGAAAEPAFAAASGMAHAGAMLRMPSTMLLSAVPGVNSSMPGLQVQDYVQQQQQQQMPCAHSHQALYSQMLEQQGAQLPVMGLDAFTGTAAGGSIVGAALQQDPVPGIGLDAAAADISMGLPSVQFDVPGQLPAASTGSSIPASISSWDLPGALTGSAAVPEAAPPNLELDQGFSGDPELLQLLGLQNDQPEATGELQDPLSGYAPVGGCRADAALLAFFSTMPSAAAVAAGEAIPPVQQQQQVRAEGCQSAAYTAMPVSTAPAAAAAAVAAPAATVLAHVPLAAGGQVSSTEYHNLLMHIRKLDQRLQSMFELLSGIQRSLVGQLRLNSR